MKHSSKNSIFHFKTMQGHILDSGNVCVSELQWNTCKMPALQSETHLL